MQKSSKVNVKQQENNSALEREIEMLAEEVTMALG